MLSICIPVFNTTITALVDSLIKQCIECGIEYEIICKDDDSSLSFKEKNRALRSREKVIYTELDQNVGRAVIRNRLAKKARYEYLLFLDSDVSIRKDDFIKTYVQLIEQQTPVAIGGILYCEEQSDKPTKLHYTYGTVRESVPVEIRNKNPYSSFLTGNLLIQKKIVEEIQFLPSIREYGHEDTLFCLQLKKNKIPVVHINNQVIHEGLETNELFILKHLTAVRNLASLVRQGHDMRGISLYDFYLSLKKFRLAGLYCFCFLLIKSIVHKTLASGKINWLFLFDMLRLYELANSLSKKSLSK